ncbi:MAG: protein-L-isoaspartate(D-aspartate) O-methyltransferase [Candidatus Aenigmarchaeota archaeon]|nr:protein-L-isoaspartate(D-aspartate) O-methyltransferase [Candidatus Aenigmarchaeota archaeon]
MDIQKENLLKNLIKKGVLKNPEVISAFRKVPREDFVLKKYREYSYVDEPLPIDYDQTISQPYTVAFMTEALDAKKGQKILEIGTGSGYQAAILSEIAGKDGKIITIERIPELYEFAKNNLKDYKNVKLFLGDGTLGNKENSPYDRIIVTASAPSIPQSLLDQLRSEGKLIIVVKEKLL